VRSVEGDLLQAKEQYICHQCNCVTQRAAHLSAAVFKAFPHADIYSTRPKGQKDKPGTIVVKGGGEQRLVINMLGQVWPGSPKYPEDRTDGFKAREEYFARCLMEIAKLQPESLAFPYGIGCGAAGGEWEHYHWMLSDFELQTNVDMCLYLIKGKP